MLCLSSRSQSSQRAKLKSKLPSSPGLSPEIGVYALEKKDMDSNHVEFIKTSNLQRFGQIESWVVKGTNSKINYATHGVYRYFGKFPAPIAAKIIQDYSKPGDLILDPACGSGTTGVEALLGGRECLLFDVNPLSVLISKVKTTQLEHDEMVAAVIRLKRRFDRAKAPIHNSTETNLQHWFLPKTIEELSNLKLAISRERNADQRDYLLMVFASIIRRVSKATTQQGRLFLDVTTAIENVWPFYEKAALNAASRISELPGKGSVIVTRRSILEDSSPIISKVPLIIYHPPYFNAYKYTSINSLEMAWLNFPRKDTRPSEIREFFKVGKIDNAIHYVDDMVTSLRNVKRHLSKHGVVAMMIGDALMKGEHVDVTSQILQRVQDIYKVEKTIVRIPKYTEATWASSQRRKANNLGVTMFDFIVILRAK
jgi:DNA modification methylase